MGVNINNRVVLDASSILSLIFPDEKTPKEILHIIRKATKNQIVLLAPTLLNYEVGNAIRSAVKQKRINEITAKDTIDVFAQIKITYLDPNISTIINLSLKHNLSFYDASYLALAIEKNAKLQTLDIKLKNAINKN